MNEVYFSQHYQDKILANVIFKDKGVGVFLDIGANDGVTYSNTFFLEKKLGWNGLCIEPLPSAFNKLSANRKCLVENCAVGNTSRKDILIEISGYSEMLSGLKHNYNKKHLSRIDNELSNFGGNKREIEINCININDLLLKYSLYSIDYCNIDTEGSELEIIKAIDFKKYKIDVITIEANYEAERMKIKFTLFFAGYRYITSLGNDMLFIHRRFFKANKSFTKIIRRIESLMHSS